MKDKLICPKHPYRILYKNRCLECEANERIRRKYKYSKYSYPLNWILGYLDGLFTQKTIKQEVKKELVNAGKKIFQSKRKLRKE